MVAEPVEAALSLRQAQGAVILDIQIFYLGLLPLIHY